MSRLTLRNLKYLLAISVAGAAVGLFVMLGPWPCSFPRFEKKSTESSIFWYILFKGAGEN